MELSRKRFLTLSGLILLLAAGWKFVFLLWGKIPFNSDEAVVGLMARHILNGAAPVFFYGQSYMGSLDAWLVAAGFAVFGQHVWVIRLVQTLLYLGVAAIAIRITYLITRNKKSALAAGLLLVFPTVNVFLYTTASLGGYNEALLIGNILILLAIEIRQLCEQQVKKTRWIGLAFLWGLFAGMGMWANALTLIYIIPTFLYWIWFVKQNKQTGSIHPFQMIVAALAGLGIGAVPLILYGFQNGWSEVFGELLGSAVSVESGGFFQRAGLHVRNLLLLGLPVILGIRPPWGIQWLILPLLPFNLIAWVTLVWISAKNRNRENRFTAEIWMLTGIILLLVIGFIFTSFGVDPSGRYFLPLYIIAAVGIGILFQKPGKAIYAICLGILITYNLLSTLQCAIEDPPAITTQFYAPSIVDHAYDIELIEFLTQEKEYLGYTNYWVSYPLAFLSGEQIIYTPRLPYHTDMSYTERDDRYEPYRLIVSQAEHPAYILTGQMELETRLRESFVSLGATWKEKTIGDYLVFYALSKTIHPADIGLGVTTK